MSEALAADFEDALDGLGVTATRTAPDGFEGALAAAIDPPAVGAPLPFEELSLPEEITTHPTPEELRAATTGVTAARLGIAAYGSLAIQSRPGGDEPISLYPERHVAVLRAADLVPDVATALDRLDEEFSRGLDSAVLTTGVSATGDMGAIVEGVHGPLEAHVIVVEP